MFYIMLNNALFNSFVVVEIQKNKKMFEDYYTIKLVKLYCNSIDE